MKVAKILAVFRKDLKDVLRDRKTLLFMLVLPTLAMPALMMGVSRFMIASREKRQTEKVVIAVSPEDRAVIERLMAERAAAFDLLAIDLLFRTASPERYARMVEEAGKLQKEEFDSFQDLMAGKLPEGEVGEALREEMLGLIADIGKKDRARELTPEQSRLWRDMVARSKLDGLNSEFVEPSAIDGLPARGRPAEPASLPEWVRDDEEALRLARAITSKRIQAAIELPDGFEERLRAGEATAEARIYFDSTIPLSQEGHDRLKGVLDSVGSWFLKRRLADRGLESGFVKPLSVTPSNVAPRKKQVQAALGGLLPYMIILFCFLGAFYPALDLGAGEKERQTLETLLLSPASRFEIAAGKFLVILVSSCVAALLGLISMSWTLTRGLLPAELVQQLDLSFDTVALVVSAFLTVPVASIFASLLLSISIYARSFKEGQSYAAPMQILIIVPAIVSVVPDVQLSWKLAAIPIVNVSLVMREFMKGEYQWGFFAVTLVSTLALALLAIGFAAKWFDREQVIFRA